VVIDKIESVAPLPVFPQIVPAPTNYYAYSRLESYPQDSFEGSSPKRAHSTARALVAFMAYAVTTMLVVMSCIGKRVVE